MKTFPAIFCVLLLGSTCSLSAQSTFYSATSGRVGVLEEYEFVSNGARSTVAQAFKPSLPTMEFADVGVVLPTNGIYEFTFSDSRVTLVTSRNFQPGGALGRTRVVFPNAVSVTPGAEYLIAVSTVAPTTVPSDLGNVTLVDNYLANYNYTVGQLNFGGHLVAENLDFGAGVFIPDLLPAPGARQITYVEQQGDIVLFPEASLTNPYVTNYAGCTLTVGGWSGVAGGSLRVAGTISNTVHVDGLPVGTVTRDYSGRFPTVTFYTNVTEVTVQSVLRQFIYRNDSEAPSPAPGTFTISISCAQGVTEDSATIQFVPVNDPPLVRFDIVADAYYYAFDSGLNRSVIVVTADRRGANVILFGGDSDDPDQTPVSSYLWSSATQPDWTASAVTVTNHFARGANQATLRVSDGQLFAKATRIFEVISPGEALRRLRKSVRAGTSGRSRVALVKAVASAQVSLSHRHPRAVAQHLEHFRELAALSTPNPSGLEWHWHEASLAITQAVENQE